MALAQNSEGSPRDFIAPEIQPQDHHQVRVVPFKATYRDRQMGEAGRSMSPVLEKSVNTARKIDIDEQQPSEHDISDLLETQQTPIAKQMSASNQHSSSKIMHSGQIAGSRRIHKDSSSGNFSSHEKG